MKNTKHEAQDDSLLNGTRYHAALEAANSNAARHNRWKWMMAGMLALIVALALPSRAHAGILDIFDEIFGTIQNDMGSALSEINQMTHQMQQLSQQTLWPLALLNQA